MGEPKKIYQGRVVNLTQETVRLPNGNDVTLDIMRHPGASAIVALNAKHEVVLIKQYRHAVGKMIWEIPAGTLDEGEAPLVCAHRELEEEAGYKASEMIEMTTIETVPGFCDERITLFLAEGLIEVGQKTEPDECIEEVRLLPLEQACSMIEQGEITDAKTCVALMFASRLIAARR